MAKKGAVPVKKGAVPPVKNGKPTFPPKKKK